MMYEEFEKIAGYEVTYETYSKIIEPMYMALTDVSKYDFVKMLNKKQFALPTEKELRKKMVKIATHLMETCEHYLDFDAECELDELVKQYRDRFHPGCSFSYNRVHTGDWFWNNCPGRGCSFIVSVEFFKTGKYDWSTTLVLLKKPE